LVAFPVSERPPMPSRFFSAIYLTIPLESTMKRQRRTDSGLMLCSYRAITF
jgi:hypothetical protein